MLGSASMLMFPALLFALFIGFPVAFSMIGVAFVFGYWAFGSSIIFQFIILIPFFLGRQILRDANDTKEILRAFVVAGLVYSLPMLLEIRAFYSLE